MRRARHRVVIVLAGILMLVGFEVLHVVRDKMIAEEQTLRSAAVQYASVRHLYAERASR
jgi:hypothetical protein